jgi:TPR repeat protein
LNHKFALLVNYFIFFSLIIQVLGQINMLFKFILLAFIFQFKASVQADELKKMALDGDPQSLCTYADQLDGENLNRLKQHAYILGNIQCHLSNSTLEKIGQHTLIEVIDTKKDIKQLKQEAENNVNKQLLIWTLYANGFDVSKLTAFTWLKVAAENEHPAALTILGSLYYFGYIVPEDKDRGYQLIQQASDLNYSIAKNLISELNI